MSCGALMSFVRIKMPEGSLCFLTTLFVSSYVEPFGKHSSRNELSLHGNIELQEKMAKKDSLDDFTLAVIFSVIFGM